MSDVSTKEKVGEAVSRAKRRFGIETPQAADADGRVGIVRGALRAFGAGEVDEFLDVLGDDVQWEAPDGKRFPGGGQHSGRDAVRENFVAAVKRTYLSFGFRPESFLDVDDENAVVTIGHFEGEGVDGATIDVPGAQLWELKGNTVERICVFTDSAAFPEVATEEEAEERRSEAEDEDDSSDKKSEDESSEKKSEDESADDKRSGDESSEKKSEEESADGKRAEGESSKAGGQADDADAGQGGGSD